MSMVSQLTSAFLFFKYGWLDIAFPSQRQRGSFYLQKYLPMLTDCGFSVNTSLNVSL